MSTADSSNDLDTRFTLWRFALFLGGILLVNFSPVIFGTEVFFFRDYLTFGFPYAQYNHHSFWRGELPLWNPLNHCGVPYVAQWQTFVLYPAWWLFVAFPASWGLSLFTLVHLYFGGLAMYLLAYHWTGSRLGASLAGIVYAFNGLTQNSLTWPHTMASLAWAPLVILLVQRAWNGGGKSIFPAVIAGAMQMLTGSPEQILFTWLVLALLNGMECFQDRGNAVKIFGRFVAIVALVTLMTSAQLLPFLDLIRHSQRSAAFVSSAEALPGGRSWAMPAWGLANLFVPMFKNFRTPSGVYFQSGQFFTSSYYLGVGAFVLSLWALWRCRTAKVFLLSSLLVLSLVLSLGEHGYLYSAMMKVFPFLGFMRYPVKFMFIASIVVPLLTAYAVARWQKLPGENRAGERRGLMIFFSIALLIIIAIVWFSHIQPTGSSSLQSLVWQSGWTRALFLVAIAAALVVGQKSRSQPIRIGAHVLLPLLIWLDLQTHTSPSPNPTAPRWTSEGAMVKMDPLPVYGQSRAFVTLKTQLKFLGYQSPEPEKDVIFNRLILLQNCNLIERIPVVGGAHTLLLPDSSHVTDLLLTTNQLRAGLADFLGVSQLSDEQNLEWLPRTNALPLITGGQIPVFADQKTTFAALAGPEFDPRKVLYLPEEASVATGATNVSAVTVIPRNVGAHEIDFDTQSELGGWVVVAQSFYHNWYAEIDEQEVKIWKANHGFQALFTPAGKHRVKLIYRDKMFRAGSALSLVTLFGCLIVWGRGRVSRARK